MFVVSGNGVHAQSVTAKFGDGIGFIPADSSFSMNFSTRFQTQLEVASALNDEADPSVAMAIRRFRLKFGGFAYDPRLTYKMELALSNNDNGPVVPEGNNAANIVLDAYAEYRFIKQLSLRAGQFKLPGNRERVISSQDLQFVDRSLVNAYFNLDRDLGLMLQHEFKIDSWVVRDQWAVAKGEGRNMTLESDVGLSYTGRVEVLPFGPFTNEGDQFGSDLEREPTPKLSLAAGYSYNDEAVRSQGELGVFMPVSRDLSKIFADMMFKYRGLSVMAEYMSKQTDRPVVAGMDKHFVTGQGFVVQAGYLMKNDLEMAIRYANIEPSEDNFTGGLADHETEYTLGLSRYIVGHALKVQTDLSYTQFDAFGVENEDPFLAYRLQMELAF